MTTELASKQRCGAQTLKGAQCRGVAMPGERLCVLHSERAAEGRKRGGQNHANVARATKRLPPDLRAIADMLAEGIEATRDGRMKPAVLTAMAAGSSGLLKVIELAVLMHQVDEMRGQVAALMAQRALEPATQAEGAPPL